MHKKLAEKHVFIAQFCHSHLQSNITLPKSLRACLIAAKREMPAGAPAAFPPQGKLPGAGRALWLCGKRRTAPRAGLHRDERALPVPSSPPSPWKWESRCSQSADHAECVIGNCQSSIEP